MYVNEKIEDINLIVVILGGNSTSSKSLNNIVNKNWYLRRSNCFQQRKGAGIHNEMANTCVYVLWCND